MRLTCAQCRKKFEAERRDAVTCSPACREKRHRRLQAQTPPFPSGTFDLVMVDLPLRFDGRSIKGEGRSPQRHYPVMDVAALCALGRPLAELFAKDVAACFWVYGPRLPDTLKVIEAWDFTYKSELFTWTKITSAGEPRMGNGLSSTRKTTENAWLATRGKGLRRVDLGVSQSILAPRRNHSEKPDEAYEKLEQLYGDVRRLELFARRKRPGWTSWGNELAPEKPPR